MKKSQTASQATTAVALFVSFFATSGVETFWLRLVITVAIATLTGAILEVALRARRDRLTSRRTPEKPPAPQGTPHEPS